MKKLLLFVFIVSSIQVFAQKKDLTYFYYNLNKDKTFVKFIQAKREFNQRKYDFVLPSSAAAVKEIEKDGKKILKNQKSYTQFLKKYGMNNVDEYTLLWANQHNAYIEFIKHNPEFLNLTEKEQSNIIDKWFYTQTIK